jgi:hypothetical protein
MPGPARFVPTGVYADILREHYPATSIHEISDILRQHGIERTWRRIRHDAAKLGVERIRYVPPKVDTRPFDRDHRDDDHDHCLAIERLGIRFDDVRV